MVAAYGFSIMGLGTESIYMLFIVGVMVVTIQTNKAFWGLLLGVLYVLAYNFFLTAPQYTLKVNDPNYYISVLVFIVVAVIINTLTSKLRKQVDIAERNERMMERLYRISTGLLNSSSSDDACAYSAEALTKILKRRVTVDLGEPEADAGTAARRCFATGYPVGYGETEHADCSTKYLPLKTKNHIYGIVSIDCTDGELDEMDRQLIESVTSQTVIAVERDDLELTAQETKVNIEHERLKTNLLRSVSHDLRTPLTSISSGADFLLSDDGSMDPEVRTMVLENISSDADWLSGMVDNLLSMTRVQDTDVPLEKKLEVVDDVMSDAVAKEMKHRGKHTIIMKKPDEVLLVPMNGKLIAQVLINLIDNAIKHSRPDSTITVSAEKHRNEMIFAVADDGGGIDEADLEKIFDRFYSGDDISSDRQRGMGLGLSICRSIVEAHDGWITARNNEAGGATFNFALPLEAESNEY